jgi:hypothetical protein
VGDLIKHMVGSQWVMVLKGVVGVGVGDVVVGGRRRSMQWASDCHHQLLWRRCFANDMCMRRAWENGWESRVGGNDVVVCSWVGGLQEHLNRLVFAMVGK